MKRCAWSVGVVAALLLGCGSSSSSPVDAGSPGQDASKPDASKADAGKSDAGKADASKPDASKPDASKPVDAGVDAALPPPTKMDLVFVVDNTSSMEGKQALFSAAMPSFLNSLLNPACLDDAGTPVPTAQQPSPTGSCPAGTTRDFPPIKDVHIGFLSSSLGTFGANGCPDSSTQACAGGATNTSTNDHAHLVTRTDPCATTVVPTYQSGGFLAWDPAQQLSPPGESTLGDGTAPGLVQSVQNLVGGIGQLGCGYESQNEAWYRFLVDPAPYETISLTTGQTVMTSGTDTTLLQQRAAFVRDDSVLVIVELTDKSDSSIKESSFYPLFADVTSNGQPFHLPTASAACTTSGPLDPCCYSCGETAPTGCTADPTCMTTPDYTSATEDIALRMFGLISHKARYGIEFFYPPSRYVDALQLPTVTNESGMAVANPLFTGARPKSRVFYAAITGVPWQLVARDNASGTPDLVNGVSTIDSADVGGFKTSAELALKDMAGNTFWDDIAGDPASYVASLSPYMQESTTPRTGTDPITGTSMSPPTSPNGTNAQNGHEWNIASPAGDIEYACVFPKRSPVDCSVPGVVCDCTLPASANNPLCDPNPNDSGNPTLQSRDKAYPGIKHLAIAKGLGGQGVVASICASQLTDTTQVDYGYLPATQTIVAALKPAIRGQ